ncbi:hypothetical protein B0H11DRAFT_2190032 [Mycena galericulata]|nr:hypothetical protein B0H11DRAFT_2190032 [Mycena galericulata]
MEINIARSQSYCSPIQAIVRVQLSEVTHSSNRFGVNVFVALRGHAQTRGFSKKSISGMLSTQPTQLEMQDLETMRKIRRIKDTHHFNELSAIFLPVCANHARHGLAPNSDQCHLPTTSIQDFELECPYTCLCNVSQLIPCIIVGSVNLPSSWLPIIVQPDYALWLCDSMRKTVHHYFKVCRYSVLQPHFFLMKGPQRLLLVKILLLVFPTGSPTRFRKTSRKFGSPEPPEVTWTNYHMQFDLWGQIWPSPSDEGARGLFGLMFGLFGLRGIARHRQNGAWTEPNCIVQRSSTGREDQ